jgi:Holliday junction resolvase-like predicted endonuclease
MVSRNIRVGRLGEQAAASYLAGLGYRVLAQNWRSPDPEQRGELDLVLRHRRDLVICEVKTRTGAALAHPAEAVTEEKAARLRRLAVVWLRSSRPPRRSVPGHSFLRIDVVAVRLGPQEPFPLLSIEHLRGVA